MHEEYAQYQRIFWRDEKGLIKEYFLTTVTFGTALYIRLRPTSSNAILWPSMSLKNKSLYTMFKQDTRPSSEL